MIGKWGSIASIRSLFRTTIDIRREGYFKELPGRALGVALRGIQEMSIDRIKEIEEEIAESRRRLPSHSVPPRRLQELEELKEELEKATEVGKES